MQRRHDMIGRVGAVLLAGLLMHGCASEPRFLLDSDIPTPPGFEGRSLTGVKRSDGLVIAAQSIYAGTVKNAGKELGVIEQRFDRAFAPLAGSLRKAVGLILMVAFAICFPLGWVTPPWAVIAIAVVAWTIQFAGHLVWEKRSSHSALSSSVGGL